MVTSDPVVDSVHGHKTGLSRRHLIRMVGSALLAIAALGVLFGLAPNDSVSKTDIASVLAGDTINQASTKGAPQQSVVNGWTARDLLELIATQGVESRDHRPAVLLTILTLACCLAIVTTQEVTQSQGDDGAAVPHVRS